MLCYVWGYSLQLEESNMDIEFNKKNLQTFQENCKKLDKTYYDNLEAMKSNQKWIREKLMSFSKDKLNITPEQVIIGSRCENAVIKTGMASISNLDTSIFKELGFQMKILVNFNYLLDIELSWSNE